MNNKKNAILAERSLPAYFEDRLKLDAETIDVMLQYSPWIRKMNVIMVRINVSSGI